MSGFGLLFGIDALVVGVEDEPTGGTRVYIDARYLDRYCVIDDPEAERLVRDAWRNPRQHVTIPRPPADCIYVVDDPALITQAKRDEAGDDVEAQASETSDSAAQEGNS